MGVLGLLVMLALPQALVFSHQNSPPGQPAVETLLLGKLGTEWAYLWVARMFSPVLIASFTSLCLLGIELPLTPSLLGLNFQNPL
jgi:hypothetical protein